MATLLSNLVGNVTEGIQKIKFKDCGYSFEYESLKKVSIKSQKGFK